MLFKKGTVIIVGAGPGDPELLTVKAARYLQQADVVFTDRLVSPDLIRLFIPDSAEVIYVGKQCGRGTSTPQKVINKLLVDHARLGKKVVRLKGGDVSVFSNVLDELRELAANQIPFEIIPGITAAMGASAYAGIPLTARDHATGVRFLTFYKSDVIGEKYWKELSDTEDTLVFYMSAETLPLIIKNLTKSGISSKKQLALVEQATTPFQKVTVGSLYDFDTLFSKQRIHSPSLIIIGNVVRLHEQFHWVGNSQHAGEYFQPVEARLVDALAHEEEKKLLTA